MVIPQFWLSRRDSTSSNMGVGFVLIFVVIFSVSSVNGSQGVRLMDSTTFSTSLSTCLGDPHASTSDHHNIYTGDSLLRIMHHFPHGHPRMASFSVVFFSVLHSSFRYLRSLYIISWYSFFLTAGSWCVVNFSLSQRR